MTMKRSRRFQWIRHGTEQGKSESPATTEVTDEVVIQTSNLGGDTLLIYLTTANFREYVSQMSTLLVYKVRKTVHLPTTRLMLLLKPYSVQTVQYWRNVLTRRDVQP